MRLASKSVTGPSLGVATMEDRKRPAMSDRDETAPPAKRQATLSNGTKALTDLDPLTDRDRVFEEFTKDALIRQKNEYKRRKADLEQRVADLEHQSKYHDDHLRVIDLWFSQLIDEVAVLANETLPTSDTRPSDSVPFPTTLLSSDSESFKEHLSARTDSIKKALSDLFSKIPTAAPEIQALKGQISKLLSVEKQHTAELHRAIAEKEQYEARLQGATERYVLAERKYDRERSKAVAMVGLGAAPVPSASKDDSKQKADSPPVANGSLDSAEVEAARKEANAVAEKRKAQCDQLAAENKKLTEEVTSLKARFSGLTDEDYAKTDLFKALKSQHEDVIKRINHLEATNVQLREEATKLHAERTAYRAQMDEESRAAISETESQLAKAEADLARIRNARDELASELAQRKAAQDDVSASSEQIKELASARESRIAALETEVERLRLRVGETKADEPTQNLEGLSPDELRVRVTTLEREYALLSNELPSMEVAWKKAQALAAKKTSELVNWEEQVNRLTAEKSKADQKYFAAMKAKDAREAECRHMKTMNSRNAEIIAQLKSIEGANQNMKINLEKQVAESGEALNRLQDQLRILQQKSGERANMTETLQAQIVELKIMLNTKDSAVLSSKQLQRELETELEKLKVRLQETDRQLSNWKDKDKRDDMNEMWRSYALCPVCRKNLKDTAIKTCGHVMCRDCVDEQFRGRSRKCPVDGRSFGTADVMKLNM
ncbi:e3 ubiquitin-protein ligase bre1 [Diplodia corticola]|uniref:E3 ubiquitin protein ligase n=1 Tax=Diplodia corticola TaxID=236234 RepID=A0A1J9RET6_9PEZI|nr:e3 ubiquitin-protein ligase bre1 [Diplodia corticola]OJD39064.1 e3 ubiquitin-protein ligase bre1 [Diplodia corticola]